MKEKNRSITENVEALNFISKQCTPYNGLHGEVPPKRGTFFSLQVYYRARISLVEVYERGGKSVIPPVKRPKRANR